MAVTPEMILAVRRETADNTPGLYILDDTTVTYFLEKNQENITRASLDACRAILLRLSMNSTEKIIDVLSVKPRHAAEQYRQALMLYISNPYLNPVLSNAGAWAGGVSVSDMQTNNATADNNYVRTPTEGSSTYPPKAIPSDNPYLVI